MDTANDFRKILISPFITIRTALEIIDKGSMRIGLVVNEDQILLGTLSDGDIRRAFLKGYGLEDSIEAIYYRTPITCSINQSKEQLLQIAVTHKIFQIPIVDSQRKVIGIEEVDELLRPVQHKNKVVLMAGGLGARLQPLTNTTPKPMLHVGDKPILETIIQNFVKYGYTDIILCVCYKADIIEGYFGDGSRFGASISYIHENRLSGTAGALSLLQETPEKPFFVMNGDLLTNVNFEHMCDLHEQQNAHATMAVREYDFQVPYGVIGVNDLQIISITEKPIHKFFVNAGIYLLSPEVLSYIPKNTYFDMPTLFDKLIRDQKPVVSFPLREYWLDIGRMSDYEKANAEFSQIFEAVNE